MNAAHETPRGHSGSISSSLLVGVRSFRADAWQRLVHIYGPLVYRWCVKAGLNRQDAEDLGQEVFRAVAARVDGFQRAKPGDTFGGWLRMITRHKVADFWRQKARRPQTIAGSEFLDDLGQATDSTSTEFADTATEAAEIRRVICERALQLIREEFRETSWKAFWGTAVEGRATADVAADLKLTTTAVRKAKSRVLRRLRDEFDGLGEIGS